MTQNAINTLKPIEVAKGGTGANTLTDHGVLIGAGTGAITPLTVGATGKLLVGASGADPAFATSADGAFTFTSATAGTDCILTISNTDDSDAGSAATLQLTTGGTSAGDSAVKFSITGGVNYSVGIDNSATGDPLKISNSNALGTTDSFVMSTAGERTMPLQPSASAANDGAGNVTGDGTVYTVGLVEIWDQNADLSVPNWTAPVTGKYLISSILGPATPATTGAEEYSLNLVTSNRTYNFGNFPARKRLATFYGTNTTLNFAPQATLCDMDAADTAYLTITGSGGLKTTLNYSTGAYFLLVC